MTDEDGPKWITWTGDPQPCGWCEEPVHAGDTTESLPHWEGGNWHARPWHRECRVRAVLGGVNHLRGRCRCCGGELPPDPPEMTRREAARAAFELVFSRPRHDPKSFRHNGHYGD